MSMVQVLSLEIILGKEYSVLGFYIWDLNELVVTLFVNLNSFDLLVLLRGNIGVVFYHS